MTVAVRRRRPRAAGGVSVIVSDTFTRANSAASMGNADTGQTWVPASGGGGVPTYGVISNKGYQPSATGSAVVYLVSGVADCTVKADVTRGGGNDEGVMFRYVDASNYLFARLGATNLDLFKRAAASFVSLGSVAHGLAGGATTNLAVVMSGSALNVLLDGVSKITATESLNASSTSHGFYCSNDSARYDNFLVTVP